MRPRGLLHGAASLCIRPTLSAAVMSKDAGEHIVHVASTSCDWTVTVVEKR